MDDLRSNIVGWLHNQQEWLQEAAQRLLSKGTLDEKDIGELVEYLKTEEGQKVSDHREFNGFGRESTSDNTIHLVSIGDFEGIENLSPRSPLTFGEGNLSVVYGHNGSGKSGYARVLKKACSKPRADDLKPNVFKEPPERQRCTIKYRVGEDIKSVEWHVKNGPIDEFESIDLFDRDEAEFYLRQETEVSYTPPEIALFESLAQVCDRVKRQLQEQQDQLVSKLPDIPDNYSETEVANKYANLFEDLEDDLSDILNWSDEDQNCLIQIRQRLSTADPAQLARSKNRRKRQLDEQILNPLKNALNSIDDESCNNIQELKKNVVRKREIAVEGAMAQTSDAKFEGIGTDTWNALWEAAREYSTQIAYPEQEFPVTNEDSRCVLCHQELDTDAQKRLQNFEAYVQGKLEKDAQNAVQEMKNAINELPVVPTENTLQTHCEVSGLSEEEWLPKLKNVWEEIENILKLLKGINSLDVISGLRYPSELIQSLNGLSNQLQDEIKQHLADAEEMDREKLNKERLELVAKKWTSQQKETINQEIERLKKYKVYVNLKRAANSRGISIKANEVSEKVITDAYVQRFNEELKSLKADNIQVDLVKPRTERGQPKHQILLHNVQSGHHEVTSILSDGERRIVSLAAFLADVTGRPEKSPFIFDDPISSLDNEFEWEVALRLTQLARERQVIVLTHRLSLYGMMEEAALKNGEEWNRKNLAQRYIETFGGTSGHPADEQAWAQNTRKANNTLINRLDEAKKYWEAGDSTHYKIHAQAICTDFRKLIERTIEDDMLNKIVKRHRRSVQTYNRLNTLPKIEVSDCEFLDRLMTNYSAFEHSQSLETPVNIPDEPELRRDLNELKEWRERFKS